MEANASGPRLGFSAFSKFYEITSASKKPRTLDDFIDSPYYIDFVKFGNHLASLKPLYTDQFVEFVIRNGVKLKDWTKDYVYDIYIVDILKREPAESATERTIEYIFNWSGKNGTNFADFFTAVSANEAAHMIKTGKISPWVLYLAGTGDNLMARFTEDHSSMIGPIIDAGVWSKKFKNQPDDVEYIRSILTQAGI